MRKENKRMIINLIIAVISVASYLIFTPHKESVEKFVTENRETIVTTLPLSTETLIRGSITIFVVLMLPTIIYLARKFFKYLLLNKSNNSNV